MLKQYRRFFFFNQMGFDVLALVAGYLVALSCKVGLNGLYDVGEQYITTILLFLPFMILIYYFMDVYEPMRSRRFRKEVLIILRAHLAGFVIIFSALFFDETLEYSREVSLWFAVLSLIFLLLERYTVRRVLRYLRKRGYNLKYMLVVGAGPVGVDFVNKVREQRDFGFSLVGFLDDDQEKQGQTIASLPVVGDCDGLAEFCDNNVIDEVVVALPLSAHSKFCGIVNACEKFGIRCRIIPDYYGFLPGNPSIEEFDGIPLLNVRKIPLDDPFNRFLKRTFDIVVSLIAIILTSPLMLLIAVGIKMTSRGPVLFRQERVGYNSRTFDMFKFRSMRVADDNTPATRWTTVDDPRKTRLGAFLRKTSLDELPQFFNVLFGTMSVVGPRPERPFFVQQFMEEIPRYMVKHQVKPGITGWAQVNGLRGDTSIEKRIEYDIYFIENWDLLFDVKIMFMTIFKGLVNKNAY